MSAPVRPPTGARPGRAPYTFADWLRDNAPGVVAEAERFVQDTPRNYRDSEWAKKHPNLAGRRETG
jgi:hypothetical protein